jgi:FkbM family methyltransferase
MNKIDYDFIEIGTSDFDTEIQKCNLNTYGISVEPLKIYLDKLPDKPNVIKVNKAISNIRGEGYMSYLKPDDIPEKMKWLKGCNSLNENHPCHDLTKVNKVKVDIITFGDLCSENNVNNIRYLKIDTEGHDINIVKSMIEYCDKNKETFPDRIMFESIAYIQEEGERTKDDLDNIITELEKRDYKLIKKGWDTILERKR